MEHAHLAPWTSTHVLGGWLPRFEFVVEDRLYPTGQAIPVTIRNTKSSGTPQVKLTFADLPALTAAPALEAGARRRCRYPFRRTFRAAAMRSTCLRWTGWTPCGRRGRPCSGRRCRSHARRGDGSRAVRTRIDDQAAAQVTNGEVALAGANLPRDHDALRSCDPGCDLPLRDMGRRAMGRARLAASQLGLRDRPGGPGGVSPGSRRGVQGQIRQTQTSYAYLDYAALVSGGA